MEITVDTRALAKIEADALVTYAFEQEKPVEGVLAQLDEAAGGALTKLAASGELTGKMLETTLLYYPQGLAAQRLLDRGRREEGQIRHGRAAQACRRGGAHAEIAPGEERGVPRARKRSHAPRRRRPSSKE